MPVDPSQFEAVVREYADDLKRYALWLCKDPTFANDLIQETYLRAWRSFDKLRDAKAAKSWLITILRREFARTFERKVPDLTDIDGLELADPGNVKPEGDSEVRLLRQAMSELDAKYREPLMLQVIVGLSCEEIAGELGISRSAVMTQLFRAREKLKKTLSAEPESNP
ncbi:MAG: sigma-70 family RNA polymerase sigma factor [Xanthomonadales bacterium]|nr:sigma-70 family RNA polymerase sigma factor [Xanthomonadales bacterium]